MCATATSAADEPRALCIIWDMSNPSNKKSVVNLPASTTASQLMKEVGKKFQYEPDSFELILQRMSDKELVSIHEHSEETLAEMGFRCIGNERNNLIIESRGSTPPKKIAESEEVPTLHKDKPCLESGDSCATPSDVPSCSLPEFQKSYSYFNASSRQETGFVGLVNQAMTCYLNSLLQTLYMTPEFRNALYRWEFDGTEEEGVKSIPFQLQKLFLLLQTSKKPAVGTTELTTSFGWDSSEAWQQHDVQELCRVMFDALEQKFKNTEQSDLISTLYEGKLKDYVKCLQCGYESARIDTFLDIPLVVRPFGSSQAYASVGEALKAFVTPEILQGSNQYFCDVCNKKCDAHKGLKFMKFPYMLTLQLKRFDFDPVTMHRIKLNDRVSFPEILTLNEFIELENQESSKECDRKNENSNNAMDCTEAQKEDEESRKENDESQKDDDDEGIDVVSHELCINEKNLKKSMEKGPYVYELFSIMVHCGSANGGHYYAYIKDFNHGEWYCFNDAQVTRITYDDIQKTYGGGPTRGYYSSAYSSSTNAYMLMYRQIDKKKNAEYLPLEKFPEHVQAALQCMQEQEERERKQKEMDRYMCKIKLFCQYPVEKRMVEMKLKVHKDCTLAEATATAHTIMGLEGNVPLNCCRLVKYDDFHDSLESSFENCDDITMGELLGGAKSNYKFELFLEVKKPNEEFQVYKPGGTTIKAHLVDLEKEEIALHPLTIRTDFSSTVEDLKMQLAKMLETSPDTMRIVLEVYSNEYRPLFTPSKTLSSEGFRKSSKVFVEYKDKTDFEVPYNQSKLFKILDCHVHTICILICLPTVDQATIKRLKLYDVNSDEESNDLSSEEDVETSLKESDQVSCFKSVRKKQYQQSDSVLPVQSNVSEYSYDFTKHDFSLNCDVSCFKSVQKKQYQQSDSVFPAKSCVAECSFDFTKHDFSLNCDEGEQEVAESHQNNTAILSDQSEDSSLTDSERTLVGNEMSPRNNSPDVLNAENDIQNLHFNDSSEVSKPECDSVIVNSETNCHLHLHENCRNMSSPEENSEDYTCENATCCRNLNSDKKRGFRAYPHTDYETGEKMLRVYVDKRITLFHLKKELEPFIGLKSSYFRIYRVYSNNQKFECTRLSENLMSYGEDSKLVIKLGRALRKGEYKIKIYQLCINEAEPFKFLIDWVLSKNMTILLLKKEILPEIEEKCCLEIPLNRCRLRKKSWKNPGSIYFDHMQFEKDIPVNANWEVFLEVLPDAEIVTSSHQLTVFTRWWHPSTFKLDPFKEITSEDTKTETLVKKIFETSGIPEDSIEFSKGQGTFPCEISPLNVQEDLVWLSLSANSSQSFNCEDGDVIFYRDKREELKKLTEEERREIIKKMLSITAKSDKNTKNFYSPRKEKALKIYTVDTAPTQKSNHKSEKSKQEIPDLD